MEEEPEFHSPDFNLFFKNHLKTNSKFNFIKNLLEEKLSPIETFFSEKKVEEILNNITTIKIDEFMSELQAAHKILYEFGFEEGSMFVYDLLKSNSNFQNYSLIKKDNELLNKTLLFKENHQLNYIKSLIRNKKYLQAKLKLKTFENKENAFYKFYYLKLMLILSDNLEEIFEKFQENSNLDADHPFLNLLLSRFTNIKQQSICLLIASLNKFPYNWTTWLELLSYLDETDFDIFSRLNYSPMNFFFLASFLYKFNLNKYANKITLALLKFFEKNEFLQFSLINEEKSLENLNFLEAIQCNHEIDLCKAVILYELKLTKELENLRMNLVKNSFEEFFIQGLNHSIFLQDYNQAIKCFKKCLIIRKNDSRVYYYLAKCYNFLEEINLAVENSRKAIELNYYYYDAWFLLGNIYEKFEKHGLAIFYYQNAVKSNTTIYTGWEAVGKLFEKNKMSDIALNLYMGAFDKVNQKGQIYLKLNIIEICISLNLLNEARQHYLNLMLILKQEYKVDEVNLRLKKISSLINC